jgi:agmatine/peptidylarginine deiminase
VTVIEQDPVDDNYRPLADNLKRLRAMRDEDGRPFRIETPPSANREKSREVAFSP